ncbi:MAG: RNA 2',3'-cyclic phosphodiesterase [Pseudomonadota bacterium]|nr:RNA 2',3'-cyclic phosphodiesterase [Pseudomonadota bacterium]
MRCFIGIPVCDTLADECVRLAEPHPGAVPKENLHMTLAFLGDCQQTQVDDLMFALPRIAETFTAFSVALTRCEPFPRDRGPYFALSGALTEPLQSLHGRVAKLLMDQEMLLESRPFRPHITLAKPGGPVTRVSGSWTLPVNTLQLYQSQRGADGRPVYHSLGQFPFSCP